LLALARASGPVSSRPGGALEFPVISPPWQAEGEDVAVELASEDSFDLSAAHPLPPERKPLPTGDLTTAEVQARSGAPTDSPELRAPAPDQGAGAGRPEEVAWRRDASTLHARLSDGARVYRPAREKTGAQAASPQALRQEPRVGVGDSSVTGKPRAEDERIAKVSLPTEGDDSPPEPTPPPVAVAALVPGAAATRGVGPLEAEKGPKTFDTMQVGLTSEASANRAASSELNPGLVDFSAPSSIRTAMPGLVGRGPGSAPGVTERKGGVAPSLTGGQPVTSPIGALGAASDERVYFREHQEIRQRVARALRFPRRLAILLEQGEAIVTFQVERSGHLSGEVKLIKSAGFEEFDREAVEVVRRAAPFPTLPKTLQVRMRIPFENPVIQ
jgi:TonB family protein